MNKVESDNAVNEQSQANVFNHILRERLLGILSGITFGWGICFIAAALFLDGHKWEVANWTVALISCVLGLTLIITVIHIFWSHHKYIVHK